LVAAIRCGITFETAGEFRAAIVARGPSVFVPFPDEVAEGETLEVDISIGEARVAVKGTVVGADFDEIGNVGLNVKLDEPSWKAVNDLDGELRAGRTGTALFASTRLIATPAPIPAEPLPVPGDAAPEEIIPPGTLVDGRFRIEQHLATGGMGEVYRAEHVLLKRPVALKMLRRALSSDADMWGRFEREAQLVSRLENPHVVRVFDFGRTPEGQLFLAMEFVEGETLAQRLEKGPLAPAAAVEILAQVLDGLHEAHGLGVVHRDLKPPNIMLGVRREGGERAKILDFGIARLNDSLAPQQSRQLTQLGVIVGTPAYLAPEQALADELDHRTDIYAMGCVAYELLTGHPPFEAKELRKIISMHLTSAPVDLAKARPELAMYPELCAAVLKALAKERENRFQNVLEFREALRTSLELPGVREVPLAQLVPVPSAPWPPPTTIAAPAPAPQPVDDWQPAAPEPAPPPATPAPEAVAAADDFFVSVGSGIFLGTQAATPSVSAAPAQTGEGAFVRIEVLGVTPSSPEGQACTARVKALALASGGFLAGQDEEGLTFGVIGRGGRPGGRVTKLMQAARDAVMAEGGKHGATATIRAFAGQAEFPLPSGLPDKVRRQLASARANTLWLDQRLAGFAARQCELASTGTPGLVACGPPRRRARGTPELLGRSSVLEALERRLASLAQGVGAPVLVKGPQGSGLSSLTNALITGARKRGALALSTIGLSSEPFGALIELLCQAVGVHPATRLTALAPALEKLPVVESARLAALWLAGVRPLPQPLTPGQAAHALRVIVRAVATDRLMVIAFDGLHAMDALSVEAFLSMAQRPASRELLVGLTAESPFDAKLAELQAIPVPPLSQAEVHRLVAQVVGGVAGPALGRAVFEASDGVPGTALHLVGALEDSGLLMDAAGGVVELSEPELPLPEHPAQAAIEAMPAELRQCLQVAATLGTRFELSVLQTAYSGASQGVLAALAAQGWLVVDGPRRMRFSSAAAKAAVPALGPADAKAVHLRAATQLIQQGTVDATAVDHAQLAGHLTSGGDGARALPVWKHALELASSRRDPRAASRAWAGLAGAMGLMPAAEGQTRAQLEALTRAAAQALVVEDVTRARGLVEAAGKLASAVPSAEYLLVESRVLRAEGRRVKAAEVLAQAEQLAGGSRILALVLAERGEAREVEGDLEGASKALQQALQLAAEAVELARWHGEVDLPARLEARLATISFARRDVGTALTLLESSLAKWRQAAWPFAEARVLSTMGTVFAYQQRFVEASGAYQAASQAGARSGDYKFQARALLQQAKALRRAQGDSALMKSIASEARKLALVVGWEEGRVDASALLGQ
jgi:serine/threonine-protein kinase